MMFPYLMVVHRKNPSLDTRDFAQGNKQDHTLGRRERVGVGQGKRKTDRGNDVEEEKGSKFCMNFCVAVRKI